MSLHLIQTAVLAALFAGLVYRMAFVIPEQAARAAGGMFLAGVLVLLVVFRTQYLHLYSDAPCHIRLIQATLTQGTFPPDPFFRGFPTPLHYSLLHVLGGGMSVLAGSVEGGWLLLGCGCLILAYGATIYLAKAAFPVSGIPYAAGILAAGLAFGSTAQVLPSFGLTACMLFFVAAGVIIRMFQAGEWSWSALLIAGLCCGLAISVRLFDGIVGTLAIFLYLSGRAVASRRWAWGISCFLFLLLACLVSLPWWANLAQQATGSAASVQEGVFLAGGYGGPLRESLRDLFRYVPLPWLRAAHVALLALGICIVLFTGIVDSEARRLLLFLVVLAAGLLLLPWETLLAGLGPYRLYRLMPILGRWLALLPVPLLLLATAAYPVLRARGIQEPRRAMVCRAMSVGILLLVAFPFAAGARLKAEYGVGVMPRFASLYLGSEHVLTPLRDHVVLSDGWTSYFLSPVFGFQCVTIPEGHASALVDVNGRSRRIRALFQGHLSPGDAEGFLAECEADFILINRRLACGGAFPHFDMPAMEYAGHDEGVLPTYPFLRKVYEDDRLLLYRVDEESSPGERRETGGMVRDG